MDGRLAVSRQGEIQPARARLSVQRSRSDVHELKHEFRLHTGLYFFTQRLVEHWSRLPESVECPSLQTLRTQLEAFLCPLLQVSLPWQGLACISSKGLFLP